MFESANRVLRLAFADGGGSHHKRAIRDGLGDGSEFFGSCEQRRSSNGGTSFAEGEFIGIYHAKMEEAEVAHGTRGGAHIERIARLDEDDAQMVEFGLSRQGSEFTPREKQSSMEVKSQGRSSTCLDSFGCPQSGNTALQGGGLRGRRGVT